MLDVVWNRLVNFCVERSNGNVDRDNIMWGLAVGLAGGLAWSLAGGLAWSLAGGLAWSLAGGLAWSLAGGLAVGLAVGLAWSLGTLIGLSTISLFKEILPLPLWIIIISIIIFAEICFLFDSKKPTKKQSMFWFTAKRKILNFVFSGLIISQIIGFYNLGKKSLNWLGTNQENIVYWIGIIGFYGIIILGIIIIIIFWIVINSLKYKK